MEKTAHRVRQSPQSRFRPKSLLRYLAYFVLAVCGSVLFKSFVVEIYLVPSQSMEPNLMPGDYLLVTKFSYFLRTPFYLPLSNIPISSISFPGFKSVYRNDVVVFRSPNIDQHDLRNFGYAYVKRCVALPGDTVGEKGGRFSVNADIIDSSGIGLFIYDDTSVNARYRIPARGDTLCLDRSDSKVTLRVIQHDGHRVETDSLSRILIDGVLLTRYIVEQNYYFMMGDNRLMSSDSRKWGCVPESNIIGQAVMVVWSWSPDISITDFFDKVRSIRWSRIGKTIE